MVSQINIEALVWSSTRHFEISIMMIDSTNEVFRRNLQERDTTRLLKLSNDLESRKMPTLINVCAHRRMHVPSNFKYK